MLPLESHEISLEAYVLPLESLEILLESWLLPLESLEIPLESRLILMETVKGFCFLWKLLVRTSPRQNYHFDFSEEMTSLPLHLSFRFTLFLFLSAK